MKVAIYHNLPSGGGKRALWEMTKRLGKACVVDVFTLTTAEHEFCDLRPYCRRHTVAEFVPWPLFRSPFGRLNQTVRATNLQRLKHQQAQLANQIDCAEYDVVFVHNCQFGQSPPLLQYLRTPSVYYCAEPPRLIYEPVANRSYLRYSTAQRVGNLVDPSTHLYRTSLKRLDRLNTLAATKVLVNSHYSLETLYRTYGLLAQTSPLGVNSIQFRATGEQKQDFVLSVGAVGPHKGYDFLICSLGLLPRAIRPPLIVAANSVDPREQTYLVSLANQHEVTLEIRQRISDAELIRLYNCAQLVLYAPVMEPFGFVPLEAMACGTAVLGVAEGGVRETIQHGSTGWLVERDLTKMAQAIASLMSQPQVRSELAHAGRQYVAEHWTWERAIDVLIDRLYAATSAH
jgi:glycosyltransferase involved in cell wall biosynthesis